MRAASRKQPEPSKIRRERRAQLIALTRTEREANHDLVGVDAGYRVVLERDHRAILEQLEALDAAVAGVRLVVHLDLVAVEPELDVLRVGGLLALEEEVAPRVELGVGERDAPEVGVLLDRHGGRCELHASARGGGHVGLGSRGGANRSRTCASRTGSAACSFSSTAVA